MTNLKYIGNRGIVSPRRVSPSRVICIGDHNPHDDVRHETWKQKSEKSYQSNWLSHARS